MQENLLLCD